MTNGTNAQDVRSAFIEKVGLISQADGLPRIAGRVFGTLVFDGDVVSFGDLATNLQVSRASISSSIRLLEERGLVKRVAKPGDRQDYFQLATNPYANLLAGAQKRTRAANEEIRDTIRDLPVGADAITRLAEYAEFYRTIETSLGAALKEISGQQTPRHEQSATTTKDQ